MNIVFKGISTYLYGLTQRKILLKDEDLIKRDILNALFTSKGSVPKNRNFGTSLPTLLMKQMTDELIESAKQEIVYVLSNEPRISISNIEHSVDYDQKRLDFIIVFQIITIPNSNVVLELYLTFTG
ncbi:MAG: GPW/gp25 family protein [Candidatus Riesia sp.]|nr:GPW/gp25 family protein [Candidatus Riesia sp.]